MSSYTTHDGFPSKGAGFHAVSCTDTTALRPQHPRARSAQPGSIPSYPATCFSFTLDNHNVEPTRGRAVVGPGSQSRSVGAHSSTALLHFSPAIRATTAGACERQIHSRRRPGPAETGGHTIDLRRAKIDVLVGGDTRRRGGRCSGGRRRGRLHCRVQCQVRPLHQLSIPVIQI